MPEETGGGGPQEGVADEGKPGEDSLFLVWWQNTSGLSGTGGPLCRPACSAGVFIPAWGNHTDRMGVRRDTDGEMAVTQDQAQEHSPACTSRKRKEVT